MRLKISFQKHFLYCRRISFMFILLCTIGCSLDIPYENRFSDPDAISTPIRAKELLATAYAELPDASFELSVLSDDFDPTPLLVQNTELSNLYKWQPSPIEVLSFSLWEGYYSAIAIANAVLERTVLISPQTSKEEILLRSVIAEAKVIKAHCFFNLLRLFAPDYGDGDGHEGVPLKRMVELEFLPRASIATCVEHIRILLSEALESDYTSVGEYWFSPMSACYLMAELELYAHNYKVATDYARKVIRGHGGEEALSERSYRSMWGDTPCPERIFSRFVKSVYYTDISLSREKGDYLSVSQALTDSYAPEDLRREATIYTYRLKNQDLADEEAMRVGLGKYNRENKEGRPFRTVNRYRVSGAYFIMAEALCRMGDEPAGIDVANRYLAHRKALLLPSEGLSGDALIRSILQEKWKEFVGEGERFFDLKRLRKTVLSDWNRSGSASMKRIASDDYRWNFPIPKGEYLYNKQMTQNEGWPKIGR